MGNNSAMLPCPHNKLINCGYDRSECASCNFLIEINQTFGNESVENSKKTLIKDLKDLKQIIELQISNCKKFAGSTNNDYYEGATDAYTFIKEFIKNLEDEQGK